MAEGPYAQTLAALEAELGEPTRPGPLSWEAAAHRDEREAFPDLALQSVADAGIPAMHVPAARGGAMDSLERILAASYVIGRRDPTVALVSGLQMWSHLLWMTGSPEQQAHMQASLADNALVCLAASESAYGADLLANECRAEACGSGFRLYGQKWPIGCATHARVAFVLARTRDGRNPRALTWFMLDEALLSGPACQRLDKVPTLGFRGADLSGLALDGVKVPASAMIGSEGSGFEHALKLFQLTRPLVAGLSLGPGETGLRVATEFALDRVLYRAPASTLPSIRRRLVYAWVDFSMAELLLISAVRGAHFRPAELSVGSTVGKVLAPFLVRRALRQCAAVLGARFFFRDFAHGAFQKAYRDQSVVSIIDGSTDVCLQILAAELPRLLAPRSLGSSTSTGGHFRFDRSVPALEYSQLELVARGGDSTVLGIDRPVAHHDTANPTDQVGDRVTSALAILKQAIAERARALSREHGSSRHPQGMDLARRYVLLHALTVCANVRACSHGGSVVMEEAAWLWLAAKRLTGQPLADAPPETELIDTLFAQMQSRVEQGSLFSALIA